MTMSVTLLQRTFYARAAILMAIQFAGASDERRVRCRTGYTSRKIDWQKFGNEIAAGLSHT